MFSIREVRRTRQAKLPLTPTNLALASQAMDLLWAQRLEERGYPRVPGRSGSCKFAALLARDLFGGKLDGNLEHVFVRKEREVLDLNNLQDDVLILADSAHLSTPWVLEDREYRESLASCMPRVKQWCQWVLEHPDVECNPEVEPAFDQLERLDISMPGI